MKYVSPAIDKTAFNCPHCGALAKQNWADVFLDPRPEKEPLPVVLSEDDRNNYVGEIDHGDEKSKSAHKWFDHVLTGAPVLDFLTRPQGLNGYVLNVWVSRCFNCNELSLWIDDRLIYPVSGSSVPPNKDMPADIKRDYDEASSILDLSPRGSAALLRLAIQKLCIELGQPGKRINDDIKSLVSNGLSLVVQQALDTVRVIGNSAVHPGQIDIRDDRQTAESLFMLVNLIVEKMISEPKNVQAMYDSLPGNLIQGIKDRDKK